MIDVFIIEKVKEKQQKEREQLGLNIKYLIESKAELERIARVGEDAKRELIKLEDKIRDGMYKYLGWK